MLTNKGHGIIKLTIKTATRVAFGTAFTHTFIGDVRAALASVVSVFFGSVVYAWRSFPHHIVMAVVVVELILGFGGMVLLQNRTARCSSSTYTNSVEKLWKLLKVSRRRRSI